jgi:hypothetical protein
MSLYRLSKLQTAPPPQVSAQHAWFDDRNQRLREQPSDLSIWTEHAHRFLFLNYPELAVGDAHKAILLYQAPDDPESETGDQLRETWRKASQILCQALIDCHCEAEALTVAEECECSQYNLDLIGRDVILGSVLL